MSKTKVALIRLFTAIRIAIANAIYQHEIPFMIAYTKKVDILSGEKYPAVRTNYKVLAEFDLPNSDRHYMIYIIREDNQ